MRCVVRRVATMEGGLVWFGGDSTTEMYFWTSGLVYDRPSVCGWNNVDNSVSIPNILFNFFMNSTANCDPLSDTTLSNNLCNFYILSLNNCTNSSTNVPSVVATKCVILDNLSHITKIVSFLATNSNLVIKSIIRYV